MTFEELHSEYNKLEPGSHKALVKLVRDHIDLLDTDQSVSKTKFKTFIAIRSNYATALYALGDYDKAFAYANENVSLLNNNDLSPKDKEYWRLSNHLNAGYAAYELRDLTPAMHHLSEAIQLDPESKKVQHYLKNAASMKNKKLKVIIFLVALLLLGASFFMDKIFTFPGMVMLYIVIFLLFATPFVITQLNKYIHTRL